MYTRRQNSILYGLILAMSAVAMMVSCSQRPAHGNEYFAAPAAPFVTPFVPLGDCLVPYRLAPAQVLTLHCTHAAPAGLPSGRAIVIASVASGSSQVEASIVSQEEADSTMGVILLAFTVRNIGGAPVQGEALVNMAVAQRITPAGATAGVE